MYMQVQFQAYCTKSQVLAWLGQYRYTDNFSTADQIQIVDKLMLMLRVGQHTIIGPTYLRTRACETWNRQTIFDLNFICKTNNLRPFSTR